MGDRRESRRLTCEEAEGLVVDVITGNIGEVHRSRLDGHLADCDRCRQARTELESIWTALAEVPDAVAAPDLTERFRQRLASSSRPEALSAFEQATGESAPEPVDRGARGGWGRTPATLAAGVVLGFLAANVVASRGAPPPSTGPSGPGVSASTEAPAGQFLLLLREPPEGIQPEGLAPAELVAEYAAWAGDLAAEGSLVAAEKLADDGRVIAATDGLATALGGPVPELISGFFHVRAESYEAAVRAARASPHLQYGGTIEIRAIEPAGGE